MSAGATLWAGRRCVLTVDETRNSERKLGERRPSEVFRPGGRAHLVRQPANMYRIKLRSTGGLLLP